MTTTDSAQAEMMQLVAHLAVLYREGSVLTKRAGSWVLCVQTTAGPLAWPIPSEELVRFGRILRVKADDPRATHAKDAADTTKREMRLRALTDIAWNGNNLYYHR